MELANDSGRAATFCHVTRLRPTYLLFIRKRVQGKHANPRPGLENGSEPQWKSRDRAVIGEVRSRRDDRLAEGEAKVHFESAGR